MGLVELELEHEFTIAKEQRYNNAKLLIKTQIAYWDAATLGIWAKDFIIITAKSGAGKTQISRTIADNVASQGKNVLLFALEAYQGEMVNRALYTELSRVLKRNGIHEYLNFKDFCLSKYDSKYNKFVREAETNLKSRNTNVKTIYRDSEVKVNEVLKMIEDNYSLEKGKSNIDLIIIDHLHYFDFDDEQEYKAVKKTVKALRNLTLSQNVAIILIAHLRKTTDKKNQDLVPDMEEISGTSDIFKEVTQVISLAPYPALNDKNRFATLFRICKARIDAAPLSYIGLQYFDAESNTYESSYTLCKQVNKKLEFIESEKMPFWAISAVGTAKKQLPQPKQEVLKYDNYTETDKD